MSKNVVGVSSLLILIVLFICILPLSAQNLPAMTYGGSSNERCNGIVEVPGGNGYVLVGWTKSMGPGTPLYSNGLAIKTDSAGVPEGAKLCIGNYDDEIQSIINTADGGFAITGWTKSYGAGTPDSANIFVIKIDSMGIQQWGWAYGTPFNEKAFSITQTMDGGYAITGWTNMPTVAPSAKPNIFLFKIDSIGASMWTGIYWFPFINQQDEGYAVAEIPGAGATDRYLIAGRAKILYSGNYDAFVMQTDPVGMPLLATIVAGTGDDEAYSVRWDGTAIVAGGWSDSYGPSDDVIAWKTDTAGNQIWAHFYGWQNEERVMDDQSLILTYFDLGYALAGWTYSVGPGTPSNPNFLVMKLDPAAGLPVWTRVHPSAPGALVDKAHAMVETQFIPRGYAIAGYTSSFGLGGEDCHLLTLDPQGDRPVCVIDTMPPFGDFSINLEMVSGEPNIFPPLEVITLIDTFIEYTEICSIPSGIDEWTQHMSNDDLVLDAVFEQLSVKLGTSGSLRLILYDVMGRNVATLGSGKFTKGTHLFNLPKSLSVGLYFVRADFEGVKKTTKLIRYQ